MRIDLEGAIVRTYRDADASTLAQHADNRRIWRNLRDGFPHPYRVADAHQFIARALAQPLPTVLCIASADDEPIGSIGFTLRTDVERFSAELGYWLAQDHWGRGITTQAVGAVTDYAFEVHGLRRVYAMPLAWNPASCRVLEKAGFEREGRLRDAAFKDGQWVDQFLYAKIAAPAP